MWLFGLVAAASDTVRNVSVYVRPFGNALNKSKMTIEIEVKSQPSDGTVGALADNLIKINPKRASERFFALRRTDVLQNRMFQVLLRASAWICLALIALVTLGPLGLRPESGLSPQIERFAAFAVVGALFAAAYPRYILFAALIVLGAAVMLELLQLLAPSRHGRLFDAGVKVAGGMIGLSAGWIVAFWGTRGMKSRDRRRTA